MPDFCMPSLGADMDAGTLIEWRVKPGDRVNKGDIVAVVETQKAAMEIEFFATGTIDELVVEPGTKVPVGAVIARYSVDGAALAADTKATASSKVNATLASDHLRMSPAARQRARELGIDPHTLTGSGPHGAIVMRDVIARPSPAVKTSPPKTSPEPVTSAPPAEPARDVAIPSALTPIPTTPVRAAIAAAMSRSKREIPHYYLSHTLSMKRALDWLRAENQQRSVSERLLPTALLLKAVAGALWDVPELNGLWIDGQLMQSEAVQLGTAVALRGGGVIAPALADAEQKSISEIMVGLRDLVKRARHGALKQSELTGATITVTSLGERGSEEVYGVINPPQVAIVGFGAVVDRPWVEEGALVVHPVVTVTLAADHRASDGHRGGLFLAAIDRRLQAPEDL